VGEHESSILCCFLRTYVVLQVIELRFYFPIPYMLGHFTLSIV
jgi:hypothetical protein